MVTRDDVARHAGVSPSTVSYALSGRRGISQATRERVQASIRELGYTPNALAKGLAGGRKGIIALNYPVRKGGLAPTEVQYLSAAQEAAREKGLHTLWWSNLQEDVDGMRALIREQLVDGVVLFEVERGDPRPALLRELGAQFVLLGRNSPDDDSLEDADQHTDFVDTHFELAARDALQHLVENGHRRILHVSDSADMIARGHGPTVRTSDSLQKTAQSLGLRLETHAAAHSYRGGIDAYNASKQGDLDPTAVITFNDQATVGFLHAAQRDGRRFPEDMSIIAFGMGEDAGDLDPGVTTLSPPVKDLTRIAVGLLVDRLDGREPLQNQILLPAQLVQRQSSGPARQEPSPTA